MLMKSCSFYYFLGAIHSLCTKLQCTVYIDKSCNPKVQKVQNAKIKIKKLTHTHSNGTV